MELIPYGDRGVLIAALSNVERTAWLVRLEDELLDRCDEYVVGYDSILLVGQGLSVDVLAGSADFASVVSLSKCSDTMSLILKPKEPRTIEVIYDGADLESVAKVSGLSIQQVIKLHSAPTYTVRMMGFSPGFPYLDGLDPRLHLERRASPRNRIGSGSVAIGGSHAGIYPAASPGGWHLLGHTERTLFNLQATRRANPDPKEVFAFAPGDQLRFKPKDVR